MNVPPVHMLHNGDNTKYQCLNFLNVCLYEEWRGVPMEEYQATKLLVTVAYSILTEEIKVEQAGYHWAFSDICINHITVLITFFSYHVSVKCYRK